MELLQIKYFIEAAHEGNITKTAEKLFIAQPALSQSIARLEKELEVKLFERSRNGIVLTASGRYFLERTEPLIKTLDNASQMLRIFGDDIEKTIYLNVLVASKIATDIMIKYKRENRDVIFRITRAPEDSAWSIRISGYRGDALDSVPYPKKVIFSERIMLAVPCEYDIAQNDEIDLKCTSRLPYLTYSENMPYNALCKRLWEEAGIKPPITIESDNPQTMHEMICEGIGVAFWPEYSWGKETSKKIKLMRITSKSASRAITVEKNPETELSAAEEKFFEFICKEFNNAKL